MTRDLPISVQENLDGAQEHFDALTREIVAFDERQPYTIVQEHNADFTQHTLRFAFTEPLPTVRWGRKFGDGLNGLADALDHLIYAIAIHESGVDPPPNHDILQFPVWTNFQTKSAPMWRIRLLSDEVRAAIQAEQPDPNHPELSMLWQLYQFNRSKKHRVIHMTSSRSAINTIFLDGVPRGTTAHITWRSVGLENEAPFMTVDCTGPSPDVKMQSEGLGYICVQRIGGQGKPEDFFPLGNVSEALTKGTLGIIERVASAAGL